MDSQTDPDISIAVMVKEALEHSLQDESSSPLKDELISSPQNHSDHGDGVEVPQDDQGRGESFGEIIDLTSSQHSGEDIHDDSASLYSDSEQHASIMALDNGTCCLVKDDSGRSPFKKPHLLTSSRAAPFEGPHTALHIPSGPEQGKWMHVPAALGDAEREMVCTTLSHILCKSHDNSDNKTWAQIPADDWKLLGPPGAPYPLTESTDAPFTSPRTVLRNSGYYFHGWFLHVPYLMTVAESDAAQKNLSSLCDCTWDWSVASERYARSPLEHGWKETEKIAGFFGAQKTVGEFLERELGLKFEELDGGGEVKPGRDLLLVVVDASVEVGPVTGDALTVAPNEDDDRTGLGDDDERSEHASSGDTGESEEEMEMHGSRPERPLSRPSSSPSVRDVEDIEEYQVPEPELTDNLEDSMHSAQTAFIFPRPTSSGTFTPSASQEDDSNTGSLELSLAISDVLGLSLRASELESMEDEMNRSPSGSERSVDYSVRSEALSADYDFVVESGEDGETVELSSDHSSDLTVDNDEGVRGGPVEVEVEVETTVVDELTAAELHASESDEAVPEEDIPRSITESGSQIILPMQLPRTNAPQSKTKLAMQVLTPPMLIFLLVLDAYHIRNRLQERSAIPTPRSGDSPTITAYQAHQIAIESLLPHAPWMAFLIGLDPAVCLETGFAGHVLATWYYTGGLWPWTYAVKPLNLAVWRVFVFVVRSAVRIVWPCVRPLVARITHAATPFGEAVSKCYVSAVTKTARFLSPCTHPIIAPIQYLEKWIRRFEQQVDEWTLCRTARVVGDISLVVPSSILTQICLAVARGDYSCSWMCVMGFVYVLTLLPWYISRLGEVVRGRDLRAWWYAEKAGIMVVIGMGIYLSLG